MTRTQAVPLVLLLAACARPPVLPVEENEHFFGCRWVQFPLALQTSRLSQDHRSIVLFSLADWNDEAPIRLFTDFGEADPDTSDVLVTNSVEPRALTILRWSEDCELRKATILMPSYVGDRIYTKMMKHELGHALGLGDSRQVSIMNPEINENSSTTIPALRLDGSRRITLE